MKTDNNWPTVEPQRWLKKKGFDSSVNDDIIDGVRLTVLKHHIQIEMFHIGPISWAGVAPMHQFVVFQLFKNYYFSFYLNFWKAFHTI